MEFIMKAIFNPLLCGDFNVIDVKEASEMRDANHTQAKLRTMVWNGGCTNWNLNAHDEILQITMTIHGNSGTGCIGRSGKTLIFRGEGHAAVASGDIDWTERVLDGSCRWRWRATLETRHH